MMAAAISCTAWPGNPASLSRGSPRTILSCRRHRAESPDSLGCLCSPRWALRQSVVAEDRARPGHLQSGRAPHVVIEQRCGSFVAPDRYLPSLPGGANDPFKRCAAAPVLKAVSCRAVSDDHERLPAPTPQGVAQNVTHALNGGGQAFTAWKWLGEMTEQPGMHLSARILRQDAIITLAQSSIPDYRHVATRESEFSGSGCALKVRAEDGIDRAMCIMPCQFAGFEQTTFRQWNVGVPGCPPQFVVKASHMWRVVNGRHALLPMGRVTCGETLNPVDRAPREVPGVVHDERC